MRPLLALDFDGVICDSLDECLVSAVNAHARLRGRTTLVRRPDELDPDLVARFRVHRHLVRGAGEYETLLHWLRTRDDDPTPATFAEAVRLRAADVIAFQPVFFIVRTALRSADPAAWTALHRHYAEAAASWDELCDAREVHLVTTKDLASVRHFNDVWHLALADDHLHTCERFVSKAGGVRELAGRRGVQPKAVTFVDDHPLHLADVAATGARCLWASWGYASTAPEWPALANLAALLIPEGCPA